MNITILDQSKHTMSKPALILRDLWRDLELSEQYSKWFQRQLTEFAQGVDFVRVEVYLNPTNNLPIDDIAVTLETAKHIALMSRTAKGREYRQRLIELEAATQVIADTLEMKKGAMLKDLKLDATIEATKATIEISKAKGEAAKARGETAKLKLQALKDKLAEQSRVLRAKTTELLTQGAKIKADMTASKLSMPVDTITNLLRAHGSKLKPGEANNALINLGYLEPSRAEVTVRGSYYGRTIVSSKSAHTTLARWFPAEFGTLLKEIDQYYADKASGLD